MNEKKTNIYSGKYVEKIFVERAEQQAEKAGNHKQKKTGSVRKTNGTDDRRKKPNPTGIRYIKAICIIVSTKTIIFSV